MLLCFDDYQRQSDLLAEALALPCQTIQTHRFPDGENKLTLPPELPEHVIFCRSLDNPNEKLLELLLAAKTARKLGAKTLTLIAPYLCYMRQDKAFHPGEVVSQSIVGEFLGDLFDNVITVDPHLHRIQRLQQAVPANQSITLSATSLMTEFLQDKFQDLILMGPDSESEQWVKAVAEPGQWDYGVCHKIRRGDRDVEISFPDINLSGRKVILVDDVASSGQTLAVASQQCLLEKAQSVDVLVTHALLSDEAKQNLLQAGVGHIWSTDSVSHDSNVIALHGLLKEAFLSLK